MFQTSQNFISTIFFCLFVLSSQKFLRITKEEEPLSICLPLDSSSPNNNGGGVNIICSRNICHGNVNNTNDNTFQNITLECNTKGCKVKKPQNNNQCYTEEENCSNCVIIVMTCFNGYCVGGPSTNEGQNNDNNDNKNGKDNTDNNDGNTNYNNNGNNDNDDNNDNNNEKGNTNNNLPSNQTTIIISCLDDICKTNGIDGIDGNDGDSGISCENGKCIFQTERKNRNPSNDKKNKFKFYLGIGISGVWFICIFLNFIFIFACGEINCKNCECSCYIFYMIFFAILFSPFFIIYILICFCCKIKWTERKIESRLNYGPSPNVIRNEKIPLSNFRREGNLRVHSEIDTLREIKTEPDYEDEEIKIEKKKKIIQKHSSFSEIELFEGNHYLINKKEAEIILMLYHSLKLVSKSISIYTFNIAQVNLIKKKFEEDSIYPNVILLNEDCTNFIFSDYVLISYIDSEISEESRKKYPNFKSELNSKKFFTDEFSDNILNNYTGKTLYLICNENYLRIQNDDLKASVGSNQSKISNAIIAEEIQVPIVNRKYVSNEYNICFIIDNTGSMGSWINIIKELCHNFFVEITEKFKEYKFYFACVLYADKPSVNSDQNFRINFTQDEKDFKSKLEEIILQSGGDEAEDWVSGFKMSLEELNWGNGTKLIFHIADAPAHGKLFKKKKKSDNFLFEENDTHGKDLLKLIKKCSERNIKITGINIDNVCSFKVFQKEYQKVDGPKYEIIELDGDELTKGNDYMNKKMFDIIENSINQNKAEKFI